MSPNTREDSCAARARLAGEPLYGTAPPDGAWLLLEQPGPWAADPLASRGLEGELAAHLTAQAKKVGFRLLLLRRSPSRPASPSRACLLVRCAQENPWMRRIELNDPREVLDLDLSVLAGSEPPEAGTACSELYAVCTHGRRDPCCAELGRRVLKELEAEGSAVAGRVWESSHQGGHRFAANLACFPSGVFYGRLEPGLASKIVARHRSGQMSLEHYRGRSCLSPAAQAADFLLRRQLGCTGLNDVVLRREEPAGAGVVDLSFQAPDGPHTVQIQIEEGPVQLLSCNSGSPSPTIRYVRLDRGRPEPAGVV